MRENRDELGWVLFDYAGTALGAWLSIIWRRTTGASARDRKYLSPPLGITLLHRTEMSLSPTVQAKIMLRVRFTTPLIQGDRDKAFKNIIS